MRNIDVMRPLLPDRNKYENGAVYLHGVLIRLLHAGFRTCAAVTGILAGGVGNCGQNLCTSHHARVLQAVRITL